MCKYTISFIFAETSQLWRLQIFCPHIPRLFWTGRLHREDSYMALSLTTSHNNYHPLAFLGIWNIPSLQSSGSCLLLWLCISYLLSWLRMY